LKTAAAWIIHAAAIVLGLSPGVTGKAGICTKVETIPFLAFFHEKETGGCQWELCHKFCGILSIQRYFLCEICTKRQKDVDKMIFMRYYIMDNAGEIRKF